jgi:hypothetical protein
LWAFRGLDSTRQYELNLTENHGVPGSIPGPATQEIAAQLGKSRGPGIYAGPSWQRRCGLRRLEAGPDLLHGPIAARTTAADELKEIDPQGPLLLRLPEDVQAPDRPPSGSGGLGVSLSAYREQGVGPITSKLDLSVSLGYLIRLNLSLAGYSCLRRSARIC